MEKQLSWSIIILLWRFLATYAQTLVSTPNATFEGVTLSNGIHQFLGIKFASIPQRFSPSKVTTYSTPNQKINALSPGAVCMQPRTGPWFPPLKSFPNVSMSEDCLFLNIWTPTTNSSAKLPVMMFIHGGGFVTGSGIFPPNNGTYLATENVVYVTINYRLNAFGFLALPALEQYLTSIGFPSNGGLNGIYDQIMALHWIQKYISVFGGDPNQVTVEGQSAGGFSTTFHLMSPLSSGLFHRAIVESGLPFGTPPWGPLSKKMTEQTYINLVNKANYSATNLTQLRNIPAETLLKKLFLPLVVFGEDGHVLRMNPRQFFQNASLQFNAKDIIFGFNSQDTPFGPPYKFPPQPKTQPQLQEYLNLYMNKTVVGTELQQNYFNLTTFGTDAALMWYGIATDTCLSCPVLSAATMTSTRGSSSPNVYVYRFEGPKSPFLVGHCAELPFVFNMPSSAPLIGVSWDSGVSVSLRKSFTNFAKTGDPSTTQVGKATAFTWPKYTVNESVVLWKNDISVVSNYMNSYRRGVCTQWETIFLAESHQICAGALKLPPVPTSTTSAASNPEKKKSQTRVPWWIIGLVAGVCAFSLILWYFLCFRKRDTGYTSPAYVNMEDKDPDLRL